MNGDANRRCILLRAGMDQGFPVAPRRIHNFACEQIRPEGGYHIVYRARIASDKSRYCTRAVSMGNREIIARYRNAPLIMLCPGGTKGGGGGGLHRA